MSAPLAPLIIPKTLSEFFLVKNQILNQLVHVFASKPSIIRQVSSRHLSTLWLTLWHPLAPLIIAKTFKNVLKETIFISKTLLLTPSYKDSISNSASFPSSTDSRPGSSESSSVSSSSTTSFLDSMVLIPSIQLQARSEPLLPQVPSMLILSVLVSKLLSLISRFHWIQFRSHKSLLQFEFQSYYVCNPPASDSTVLIIKMSIGIMRILYDNIKTAHGTIRILQFISKILHGMIIISQVFNEILSSKPITWLILPKSNMMLSKSSYLLTKLNEVPSKSCLLLSRLSKSCQRFSNLTW